LNSGLDGFNHRELLILSAISGKHRNKSYKINYSEYKNILQKNDIYLINILSLLLRIAENLDRREEGKITSLLKVEESKNSITIALESKDDISLEISAGMKSSGDFEKLLGKKLYLIKAETSS
jgi:exopolyphosphatase/pppGpp-phosphohydrolase